MSSSALQHAIRRLAGAESLTTVETADAFDIIMQGEASPAQVAAILIGLRVKGETAAEIAGGAQALRRAMVPLLTHDPEELVDTCGTGGGSVSTFNISTGAALVAAGAGVRIAKHGNRSFTSRCGSADVLEALGVRIELPVDAMRQTLERAGIVFMFAPLMHPAMRHVGQVRREIGVHTIMNVLGPLANPASAGRQVVGVTDPARVPLLAGALAALGTVHALVVHGAPGLDEVSPLGPTRVTEVRDGETVHWTIDPADHGIAPAQAAELAGAAPADNARIILDVLGNQRRDGARSAVLLNAAAAIFVAARAPGFAQALSLATDALESGAALEALERLRRVTNSFSR